MIPFTNQRAGETGPMPDRIPLAVDSATAGLPEPRFSAPKGVSLVPGEDVLLLAVDLPVMTASQRRASLGFAIEDRIAQPLDEVQVVPGPQMPSGQWLVAVVARSVLQGFATDTVKPALWPDVLLLPVPGSGWSVWAGGARALVRLPDGTGFATTLTNLPAFWASAGSPDLALYGGALPGSLPITSRAELPAVPDPDLRGFDLRTGLGGTNGRLSLPKGARPLLLVAGVAALAHLGLLVTDVAALSRLAAQGEAELRTALSAPADADLDAALSKALALRQPTDGGSGLLELLTQVFSSIGGQAGAVSVQDLRYQATGNQAVLTIEAPDLAALQSVQTALTGAGLDVTSGAATTSDGAAEAQITIRGGGS